jgi:ribosomal-protein-alanine N-acetyltransferase
LERRHGSGYSLFVFRAEDDVLLGGISLSNIRRGVAQTASIGYWIAERHARRGYMSESLTAMLDFAFKTLGLHRVEAACLAANEASRRLLEKHGFQEEGVARGYLRINGRWQDHVIYSLLQGDRAAPSFHDVLDARVRRDPKIR